ncbi:hypothetical protein pipiens_017593 [Culex pipiens pipiens]|uniref:HTH psq-type domain-containing protein n=1 Tax=Culex pipiens pipiens TaxID=38569 RepID=A0ABD1CFX2_CULPP
MFEDCDVNAPVNDDSAEISVEPEEEISNGEGPPKRKKSEKNQYTQVQLQLAYEAVQNGMSTYRACKMYGVPRPTLQYRIKKKITDLEVKAGPKCYLSKAQEASIVGPLHALADAGFTITHRLLKIFGMEYVKANIAQFPEGNPFPSEIPSKSWVLYFLKRHPDLATRMTENWSHYGYPSVAPERVPVWFGCVSRYLAKMDLQTVVQNRRQVFTLDDMILRKSRNDTNFTCLFGANANGNLLPPFIIYPDKIKLPTQKKQSELKYAVAHPDTELTSGNVLYQWLSKVFQPWLIEENVPRPVIVFLDCHRHQMGYLSSQFCHQHQIIPVSLLPRSDHMLRPLNLTLFGSIETLWRDDKNKHSTTDPPLQPILALLTDAENAIRDGFYQSKLYPWNPDGHTADDSVLHPAPKVPRKNAAPVKKSPPLRTVDPMLALFRRLFEARLPEQQLADFQAGRHEEVWAGPVELTGLFEMWRDLMNEVDAAGPQEATEGFDNWSCSEMGTAQGEHYIKPEMVTVKMEDPGECSVDFVKEEPSSDFEDL